MIMLETEDWLSMVEMMEVLIGHMRQQDANPEERLPSLVPWVEEKWQVILEHKAHNDKSTQEAGEIQAALDFLKRRKDDELVAVRVDGVRWEKLEETSPSGKTMFQCQACGRKSLTPDKRCPTDCQAVIDRAAWLEENRGESDEG